MTINPPQYYWKLAKDYIIAQDELLRKEGEFYIDKQHAISCIKFASMLRHTDGELTDVTFQFSEWQIKAIVDIFGTKYISGEYKDLRRYTEALIFIPKKNGKTELGAVFHLIMFFLDKTLSKNQFCIASDKDQAMILHEAILTMLSSTKLKIKNKRLIDHLIKTTVQPPQITKKDGNYKHLITTLSKPQGEEKDGKKVTFFTSDEGHAQPSEQLFKLINKGLALAKEPLRIHLSTAGFNKEGYFYRKIYSYAKKVKSGEIKDKRFYHVMLEIDDIEEVEIKDPDYWKKEEYWKMVNPCYPISPQKVHMEDQVLKSEFSSENLVDFKTKHLNIWCDKSSVWVKSSIWTSNQSKIDLETLKGKVCYGGLDLATRWDLASLVLLFPDDSLGYRRYDILCRFWIPKDNMMERIKRDRVPYFDFIQDGLIEATEGDSIDYDYIEKQIKQDCADYDVKMIAYDRYNSTRIVQVINECKATEMIPFNQTTVWMNAPINELELLAHQGKLNHQNNKVLNWHCSNVVIIKDSSGNIKFDKDKSIEKIDGMVSLAMAMGVCLKDIEEKPEESIYNTRGLLEL